MATQILFKRMNCNIITRKPIVRDNSWIHLTSYLVAPAFGPITPDVDTAAFILKHLLVHELYKEDSRLAPVPWRDQVSLE